MITFCRSTRKESKSSTKKSWKIGYAKAGNVYIAGFWITSPPDTLASSEASERLLRLSHAYLVGEVELSNQIPLQFAVRFLRHSTHGCRWFHPLLTQCFTSWPPLLLGGVNLTVRPGSFSLKYTRCFAFHQTQCLIFSSMSASFGLI